MAAESQVRPCEKMKEVFVCENPAIVSEAANRLEVNSRPLICLNGMPASTARTMLDLLATAGITIHLRADSTGPDCVSSIRFTKKAGRRSGEWTFSTTSQESKAAS